MISVKINSVVIKPWLTIHHQMKQFTVEQRAALDYGLPNGTVHLHSNVLEYSNASTKELPVSLCNDLSHFHCEHITV
jgi:hypothetical protein